MDFDFSNDQQQIREAIERLCTPFDADYWLRKDRDGGFPTTCAGQAGGVPTRC